MTEHELQRQEEINIQLLDIIKKLQADIKELQADIKELQDVTGVTFDRWKATRKEQNMLYIRDRIEYHRRQGEGMMGAKKLAVNDLRELHKRELRT